MIEKNEKLTISVSEMAELLSISRPTAYQIINREDFDAVIHIGRRTLISRSRLSEWIDRQCGYLDIKGRDCV